jgi:hypothetical protein
MKSLGSAIGSLAEGAATVVGGAVVVAAGTAAVVGTIILGTLVIQALPYILALLLCFGVGVLVLSAIARCAATA